MWGVRKDCDRNPNPNPISISTKMLNEMDPDEYVVAEKTDGVRYALMLCVDHTNCPAAVMVDRACRKYEVPVYAESTYFLDSLFDGELIWETTSHGSQLVWWCFDVVHLKGKSTKKDNYISRFAKLENVFEKDPPSFCMTEPRASALASQGKIVCASEDIKIQFRIKPCFRVTEIDTLWKSIPTLNHKNDGLIFTPLKDEIKTGAHPRQFKWKYEHTIDLQLRGQKRDGEWVFGLYYIEADFTVSLASEEEKYIDDEKMADEASYHNACEGMKYYDRTIYFVLERNDLLKNIVQKLTDVKPDAKYLSCIVECSTKFQTPEKLLCSLKKLRKDKSEPNNRYTIRQTIVNLEENIEYETLIRALAQKINILSK
jgi:hypothetical protein